MRRGGAEPHASHQHPPQPFLLPSPSNQHFHLLLCCRYKALRPPWAIKAVQVPELPLPEEPPPEEPPPEQEPSESSKEEEAPKEEPGDWQALYQQQWADYVRQMWELYYTFMQYNVPPPPEPEPPKPQQAGHVSAASLCVQRGGRKGALHFSHPHRSSMCHRCRGMRCCPMAPPG
jgi:hypothetical protein